MNLPMARTILSGEHPEGKLAWQGHLWLRLLFLCKAQPCHLSHQKGAQREDWLSLQHLIHGDVCVFLSSPCPPVSSGIGNMKRTATCAPPPLSCESALVLAKAGVCVLLPQAVSQLLPCCGCPELLLWLCGGSSYCEVSDPCLPGRVTLPCCLWRAPAVR